jgi:predicted glycosyltransferase
MQTSELEKTFNESELVLCRSGYTTLMDLAKLKKKAYLIPTPGQFEQDYLARKLKKDGILPYSKQENFKIERVSDVSVYNGFMIHKNEIDWKTLFEVFN